MAMSVFVMAPEKEPTKEIKEYLYKVVRYAKDGWIGTLVRPGICKWLVDACAVNKISIATYRWDGMPYLPDHDSETCKSDDDWQCIRNIIDGYDIVVGIVDGEDHIINAGLVYANQQEKETRNIPYR